MAIKNQATTALLFVQDVSTGLGVTGLTSGNFTSIKLVQDNVLSIELQPIIVSGYGAGYYGFAVTAAQMNYGCIMPIVVSSGNYQPYSVAMYTEQNYLPSISGNQTTIINNLATTSGNILTVQNNLSTVSGLVNNLPTITTIVTSGNAAGWNTVTSVTGISGQIVTLQNNVTTISGNLNSTSGDVNTLRTNFSTTSGDVNTIKNNLITVSGLVNNLPIITTIVASGNAANWNSVTSVDLSGVSGSLNTISGNLLIVNNILNTVSGKVDTNLNTLIIVSGNLNTTSGDISILRTNFATTSGDVTTIKNNVITVSGNLNTTNNTLNTVSGNIITNYNSTIAAIQNVQNHTFIAAAIPTVLEIPDTGFILVPITVAISNEVGRAVNIDGGLMPSGSLTNDAGVDLISRLGGWSNPSTGKYVVNYINTFGNVIEGLHWELLATVSGNMYRYPGFTQLVDTTAVDFTAADRVILNATAKQNTLNTISGNISNLPSISQIVSSGNANNWNADTNPVTVSGFTVGSLTQVITSGNAAGWGADTINVTVSGLTPSALSQIVVSGNAANWNSVTSVDLSGVSGSLVTISGNLRRTENTLNTVSGDINIIGAGTTSIYSKLIVVSGDIATLNDVSIGEIVASGNAVGWSNTVDLGGISGQLNTLSGQITLNNSIITTVSGNVTTLQNTVNTVSGNLNTGISVTASGLTPWVLSQIVASGHADGWATTSVEVNISGVSPTALSQIVSGVLNGTMIELTTIPSSSPTLSEALMLPYMELRNERVQGDPIVSGQYLIKNNDGNAIGSGFVSAVNGIFVKGKLIP